MRLISPYSVVINSTKPNDRENYWIAWQGETIALISDAGTPGISDPGERIVRAVLGAGHRVESVPAHAPSLPPCPPVVCPRRNFILPDSFRTKVVPRPQARSADTVPGTLCLYESPPDCQTNGEIHAQWPEAQVVLARELTKNSKSTCAALGRNWPRIMPSVSRRGNLLCWCIELEPD